MKKVLFVGFENHSPDYAALRSHYGILCAKYGCKAVFPIDNKRLREKVSKPFDTPLDEAKAVFRNNLQRIESADAIIANLNYFNGTGFCTNDAAFAIGYGTSKNKRVLGFVDATSLCEARCTTQNYMYYTPDERKVLNRAVSQMTATAISITIRGNIEECLESFFNDPQDEKTQEILGPTTVDDL